MLQCVSSCWAGPANRRQHAAKAYAVVLLVHADVGPWRAEATQPDTSHEAPQGCPRCGRVKFQERRQGGTLKARRTDLLREAVAHARRQGARAYKTPDFAACKAVFSKICWTDRGPGSDEYPIGSHKSRKFFCALNQAWLSCDRYGVLGDAVVKALVDVIDKISIRQRASRQMPPVAPERNEDLWD